MQMARRGILVALLTSVPLAATSLQQTLTAGRIHRRADPRLPVAGEPRRLARGLDDRVDVQRARRPQHLRRGRPRVRAAASHRLSRRRRSGADAAVVFARRRDDRLRPRRRSRIEPPGGRAAESGRQPGPAEDSDLVGRRSPAARRARRRRRRTGGRARQRARRLRQEPADLGRADRRLEAGAAGRSTRAAPASRPHGRPTAGRWRSCRAGTITASSGCSRRDSRFDSSRRRRSAIRCRPGRPTDKASRSCASPARAARPRPPLARLGTPPWSIQVADVPRLHGRTCRSSTAVTSGHAPVDPILRNPGGIGLRWAADDALVFMSYRDGFPHLYAIQHPGAPTRAASRRC